MIIPEKNKMEAWGRTTVICQGLFVVKAVAENWHQSGWKTNQHLLRSISETWHEQRNLQKTTKRLWFIGCEELAALTNCYTVNVFTKVEKKRCLAIVFPHSLITFNQWQNQYLLCLQQNCLAASRTMRVCSRFHKMRALCNDFLIPPQEEMEVQAIVHLFSCYLQT